MNADKRRAVFARLQAENPEPRSALKYTNPFELLIAVILSAQATDKSVNKATPELFKVADTAAKFLKLGEERLKSYIKAIGLSNTKAANIIRTCAILEQRHAGKVPHERAALEALPGVGRKTANVILNTAFGQPVIAVDTHVFRVANRTGLAPGKNVEEVEKHLMRTVPKAYRQNAHHWLIQHGRNTCKARNPVCTACIINELCEYTECQ